MQIFVISNGTHTKYYSNTTRSQHIKEMNDSANPRAKKTSHSFKFTNYWADGTNRVIPDLVDFTGTFFAKHTLLNVLIHYCVFTSEDLLLVMRPYQIAATERVLTRILNQQQPELPASWGRAATSGIPRAAARHSPASRPRSWPLPSRGWIRWSL